MKKIFKRKSSISEGTEPVLKNEQIREVLLDLYVNMSIEDVEQMLHSFGVDESAGWRWDDFKKLVDQPTAVEQWTSGIPFSRLVASAIPACNIDQLDQIDENEGVRHICQNLLSGMERLLRDHILCLKKARALMMNSQAKASSAGSKFTVLNCGTIDDFHGGLEKRIGNSLKAISEVLKLKPDLIWFV